MDLAPQLGRPGIENSPSGLRKITRFRELDPSAPKAASIESAVFSPYGTPDVEFPLALLTDQRVERRTERGAKSMLVQVYQELADNALTATTEVVETTTFDGRRVTRRLYLCKASQAEALRPAIGSGFPAIFQTVIEYFGPVAKVTTFDIENTDAGFVYSQSDDTKNNGKLLLRTMRTLASIAPTPPGYTLVGQDEQHIDGYTVYVANFAKGEGEISRETTTRYNGMLLSVSIRYLTAASVAIQPTSDPLGGGILVDEGRSEQDGYRFWSVTWRRALGTALIRDDVETKYNGKLKIYRRARFNQAPDAPAATIGGVVVQTSNGTQLEDGFTIYNATWAEGKGRISLETDTKNGRALLVSTVRYFATDDEGAPEGTLVTTSTTKQDGIDLTTNVYAKGNGEISRETDTGGLLERVTIRHLTALDGTQPTTDPLGGGEIIKESRSDQDGYRVWTVTWAKGVGTASSDVSSNDDGSLQYDVVTLSLDSEVPTYPGSGTGYLVSKSNAKKEGHWVNRARYIKPPATRTLRRPVSWTKPGRIDIESPNPDFTIVGPKEMVFLASIEVSFDNTQLTTPIFTVRQWASLRENYTIKANGAITTRQEVLRGIISGSTGNSSASDAIYHGVECSSYFYAIGASVPSTYPTGDIIISVDNIPYLTAIDGTVIYRRSVTTITLP